MDPNSANQWWSRWRVTVTRGLVTPAHVTGPDILPAVTRKTRQLFGSATQMRVIIADSRTAVFEIRSEGHPVHDPAFVANIERQFTTFFQRGFGPGTEVKVEGRLEAGSRQDGTPSEQLVMLPSILE